MKPFGCLSRNSATTPPPHRTQPLPLLCHFKSPAVTNGANCLATYLFRPAASRKQHSSIPRFPNAYYDLLLPGTRVLHSARLAASSPALWSIAACFAPKKGGAKRLKSCRDVGTPSAVLAAIGRLPGKIGSGHKSEWVNDK